MKSTISAIIVLLLMNSLATAQRAAVGNKAPEVAVREWVTADPPKLPELAGKPYVIEFWAMWCPPCVRNIPHLISLQERYGQHLAILGISQDSATAQVKEFIEKRGVNYHVAIDGGTSLDYGVKAIPTVVIVDHRGKVFWRGIPSDHEFDRQIELAVRAATKR